MWSGYSVFCLASGPSLTAEDVELVRKWRELSDERRVIVTNTTVQLAPWADALFAHDSKWWRHYADLDFKGERLSLSSAAKTWGASVLKPPFISYKNSGADAASLALHRNAERVYLLGYDCQFTGGKTHWHGSHPQGLHDATSLHRWEGQFARLSNVSAGRIINCSRVTALKCFPRQRLEDVLDGTT